MANRSRPYVPNVRHFFTPFESQPSLEDLLQTSTPDFPLLYYTSDDLHGAVVPPPLRVFALPGYRIRLLRGKKVLTEGALFHVPAVIRMYYNRRGQLLRPIPYRVIQTGEAPYAVVLPGNNQPLFWLGESQENAESMGGFESFEIIWRREAGKDLGK